jgi:hypothetical protein
MVFHSKDQDPSPAFILKAFCVKYKYERNYE